MKQKFTLKALAVACFMGSMPVQMQAQTGYAPSASKEVYNFSKFKDRDLLDLFYDAIQNGKMFPDDAAFERIGISKSDLAFVRSHVRRRALVDREDRLINKLNPNRNLWMNTPMGVGAGGEAGYPSAVFASDVFSLWNYTNLWGSWNHGVFTAPGSWVDAAHKNGTDILSGLYFFDSASGEGDGAYKSLATALDSEGYAGYKYVKPYIHLLMFLGHDGYNVNWESGSPNNSYVIGFHQALYKYAAEIGFTNFHMGLYTTFSSLSSWNASYLYGNENGYISDLMLNYGGYGSASSIKAAKQAYPAGDVSQHLYQGFWINSFNQSWGELDNTTEMGICIWGEHKLSRLWMHNSGSDAFDAQKNYQFLLERAFTGGARNPLDQQYLANTGHSYEARIDYKPLQGFSGFSRWIVERSTVEGTLPFATNFNLGNGDRYNYKGKKTAGAYYNMASQDIVPTYRWLVTKSNTNTPSTDIDAAFSHEDSYMGGSCLELKGKSSESTDIVLYKTSLRPQGGVYAKVALKNGNTETTQSDLSLIVRLKNGGWKEYAVPSNKGKEWEEHELKLSDITTSDVIDRIGLRVHGGSNAKYDMYVGRLEINDNHTVAPSEVKNFNVEVKEETKTTLSLKMYWDVDAVGGDLAKYGMITNGDGNIDHFEILYKSKADGRVSLISRTSQWAAYVGNIELADGDQPQVGVRAVSTDLKSYSPVIWQDVPRADPSQLPVSAKLGNYGICEMNPNSEGANIARKVRWVESVKTVGATTDINYTATGPQTDGTQYVRVTDQKLVVKQGEKFTITIKGYQATDGKDGNHDDLRYCFAGGWIDFDGSETYNHPLSVTEQTFSNETQADGTDIWGERIFKMGAVSGSSMAFVTTGITANVEIPQNAHVGQSRLRIVFSDAWFKGEFLPAGLNNKGFAMDFDVEIQGDPTNQREAIDLHDQGVADEPDGLNTTNGIETLDNANGGMTFSSANGFASFGNVEKAWIYSVDGNLLKALVAPSTVSLKDLSAGVYVVKMQSGNVVSS
ncbi:MAG TPA: endo-beta-N-acetylglucosaminidase, partial [Prevotella sp.]